MFEETLRANDFDKDLVLKLDHVPEFQMVYHLMIVSLIIDRTRGPVFHAPGPRQDLPDAKGSDRHLERQDHGSEAGED